MDRREWREAETMVHWDAADKPGLIGLCWRVGVEVGGLVPVAPAA